MYVACGLCVGFICTVSSVPGFPNALSIDYRAERLYWVDAKLDKIETSDLSGEHRVALLQQAPHPFGLTVVSVFVSPHSFPHYFGLSVFVSFHHSGLTLVSLFILDQPVC